MDMSENPAAKAFYDTVPGRVFLFDYNNQLNIDLKGQFIANYIDGTFNNKQRVAFGTEGKITAPIPDLIEKTKERKTSLHEQLEDFFAFWERLSSYSSVSTPSVEG